MLTRYTYHDFLPDPSFRLRVQVKEWTAPLLEIHSHEFAELVIMLGGEVMHELSQEIIYPLQAGDVFVINRDLEHGYRDAARARICNILYDPDQCLTLRSDAQRLPGYHALFFLEPACRRQDHFTSRLRLEPADLARVGSLIEAMEREQEEGCAGHESMLQALFMQLVIDLARCYSRQRAPASQKVLRLSRVMAFIEEHYRETIRLDQLAAIAHMSKNSLLRIFRQIYKTSPTDYIIRLRLAQACDLMKDPGRTITEIAFAIGFSDSNYFSRQFHLVYGIAPREHRRWLAGLKAHALAESTLPSPGNIEPDAG